MLQQIFQISFFKMISILVYGGIITDLVTHISKALYILFCCYHQIWFNANGWRTPWIYYICLQHRFIAAIMFQENCISKDVCNGYTTTFYCASVSSNKKLHELKHCDLLDNISRNDETIRKPIAIGVMPQPGVNNMTFEWELHNILMYYA